MSDFLTEKAAFKCSAHPMTKIGVVADGNVSFRGQRVVTDSDMLVLKTPPPFCPALSKGATVPCTFPPTRISMLFSETSRQVLAGSPLLLDGCQGTCPLVPDGKISLANHSDTQNVFRELSSKAGSENSSGNSGSAAATSNSDQTASSPGNAKANDGQSAAGAGQPVQKKEKASEQPNPLTSQVLACSRSCSAEERRNCEARKKLKQQWRDKPFKNDSGTISRNYKKRIDGKDDASHAIVTAAHKAHKLFSASQDECRKYKEDNNLADAPWGYAAHHILSGNEILLPEKKVVQKSPAAKDMADLFALIRIANFDINDADNCIMLPGVNSKDKEDPHGKRCLQRKREAAFETMAFSRLQWHCSKHGYPMDNYIENVRAALPLRHLAGREREIRNYRDLLMERFGKLVKPYKKAPVCPKEDRRRLEKFVQDLKQEIEVIRQELIQFAEKPHRSFPYFVSMEAWRYAFLLPRVAKIMAITRKEDDYLFQQFRLTRFADTLLGKREDDQDRKGEQLAVNEAGKSGIKSGSLHCKPGPKTMREYIRFCDGYDLFALGVGVDNRVTGFEIPEDRVFRIPGQEDAKKELEARDAQLLVWLLEKAQDDDARDCPSALARYRQAEAYFANL